MSRNPVYVCHNCGHRFRGERDAERAVEEGCPECDSDDIGHPDPPDGYNIDGLPAHDYEGRPPRWRHVIPGLVTDWDGSCPEERED